MKQGDQVEVKYAAPDPSWLEGQNRVATDMVTPLGVKHPIFERVEAPEEGGIFAYFRGMPYPRKGFPTPEAVYANDVVKRFIMSGVHLLGSRALILPMAVFALLPWNMKRATIENALNQWMRFAEYMYSPHMLQPMRMTACAREVWTVAARLFIELGVSEDVSRRASRCLALMIEYDDAYRYRVEDLITSVVPSGPFRNAYISREGRDFLKRAQEAYNAREKWPYVRTKFDAAFRIFRLAMRVRRVRNAWRVAWAHADIRAMMLDDADTYHTLTWDQYDFGGLTIEERIKIFDRHHPDGKYPPLVEIIHKNR